MAGLIGVSNTKGSLSLEVNIPQTFTVDPYKACVVSCIETYYHYEKCCILSPYGTVFDFVDTMEGRITVTRSGSNVTFKNSHVGSYYVFFKITEV